MGNINLIYVPMPKLKTTTIGVYIRRTLDEKEVSKNAVLPYVLRQGCKLCPDSDSIAKYLEELYGATLTAGVTKFGEAQFMRFEAQSISDRYAAAGEPLTESLLNLILSVMFEPVTENGGFKKAVFDIEKKNAKDRIMSEINDKRMYAAQRCIEEMCKGEPYALLKYGTIEGMDAIDETNLYEHYKDVITSSEIDIYVCGEADEEKLKKLISEKTAGIDFREAEKTETKIHKKTGEVKTVTDHMDVSQGTLAMGFTTGIGADSEDVFAMMMMHSVFGAGAHSKLFNNVREKLSLAYYAAAMLMKPKGMMVMTAGIDFENYKKAYDETLVQLDAVKNGEITELEFNSSQNSIVNNLESMKDSPSQMHNFMSQQKLMGADCDIDRIKEKIKAVTIEDIVRAAKKIELDTVYFLTGEEK